MAGTTSARSPTIPRSAFEKMGASGSLLMATMYLEVDITNVESTTDQVIITGNASLWKTGMRIYEIKDISIRLVDG